MKILLTLLLFISFIGFSQNVNKLKNEITILDNKIGLVQTEINVIDDVNNDLSKKIKVINDSIGLVKSNQIKYHETYVKNVKRTVWSYTLTVFTGIMRYGLGTDKYPPYIAIGFGSAGVGFNIISAVNLKRYKKTILKIDELSDRKLSITEKKQETSKKRYNLVIKRDNIKYKKQKTKKILEKLESFDYQPNTFSKIVNLSNEKNSSILESYKVDSLFVIGYNKRIGGLSFFKPTIISNSGTWDDYELSIKNNTDKRIKKIKFYLKGYNVVDEYIGSSIFTGLGWVESMAFATWSNSDFLYSRALGSVVITKAVVEYEGGSKKTISKPKIRLYNDVISLNMPIRPVDYDYYNYGHIILIHNKETGELRYSIENPKLNNVIDINVFKDLIKNNNSKYIFINSNGLGTEGNVQGFIEKYELLKNKTRLSY